MGVLQKDDVWIQQFNILNEVNVLLSVLKKSSNVNGNYSKAGLSAFLYFLSKD